MTTAKHFKGWRQYVLRKKLRNERKEFVVYGRFADAIELWNAYKSVGYGGPFDEWLRECAWVNRGEDRDAVNVAKQ